MDTAQLQPMAQALPRNMATLRLLPRTEPRQPPMAPLLLTMPPLPTILPSHTILLPTTRRDPLLAVPTPQSLGASKTRNTLPTRSHTPWNTIMRGWLPSTR